jgi:hypothetical protein
MDAAWLVRMRWRRRGAWLWPAFVMGTIADGVIGTALPPAGESQSFMSAALIGLFLNLIAVAVLAWPLSLFIRRMRPDLPALVARDYAGTLAIGAISLALLAAGMAHRSTVLDHERAMREAVARAQAWIGDRAPAEFRRGLARVDAFAIEPGSIYRACVLSDTRPRTYCVVVKVHQPAATSVRFAGYESNQVFAQGAE